MDISAKRLDSGTIGIILDRPQRKRTMTQALRASIDKWKAVVLYVSAGFSVLDGGPDSCALCRKYFHKDCKGCPVSKKTGRAWCGKTPYRQWDKSGQTSLRAAKAELKFLESLAKKNGITV